MFNIANPIDLFHLSQGALHHDDYEAITGDIPTTAKAYLKESETRVDVPASAWYTNLDSSYKDIIKLADMLEAYHFLAMEAKMGNRYIDDHLHKLLTKIHTFLTERDEKWPEEVHTMCSRWMALVSRSKSQAYT